MKNKIKYNNNSKFSNQDLENIIKISQNPNNNTSLKQNEILQRSLELLYPGEDKNKYLDKINSNINNTSKQYQQKYDDISTQPKSTKNNDYDSQDTNLKSTKSKTPVKSSKKALDRSNKSLTPYRNTNSFVLQKKNKTIKNKLNKSVSIRESSKMKRDTLNMSSINYQDNGIN